MVIGCLRRIAPRECEAPAEQSEKTTADIVVVIHKQAEDRCNADAGSPDSAAIGAARPQEAF
jgi:hypothetical protein